MPSDNYKATWQRQNRKFRKTQAYEFLGGKCACCGVRGSDFLQIHHVDSNAKEHAASLYEDNKYKAGYSMHMRIIDDPDEIRRWNLQLLCANCHSCITINGRCIHQNMPDEGDW